MGVNIQTIDNERFASIRDLHAFFGSLISNEPTPLWKAPYDLKGKPETVYLVERGASHHGGARKRLFAARNGVTQYLQADKVDPANFRFWRASVGPWMEDEGPL